MVLLVLGFAGLLVLDLGVFVAFWGLGFGVDLGFLVIWMGLV